MNSEHITLRPITRKDYPFIEDIIRKTWKYDALSSNPKDAKHMARLYLRSCLLRATFSCVAAVDGKVLGVILAGSKNPFRNSPFAAPWLSSGPLRCCLQRKPEEESGNSSVPSTRRTKNC